MVFDLAIDDKGRGGELAFAGVEDASREDDINAGLLALAAARDDKRAGLVLGRLVVLNVRQVGPEPLLDLIDAGLLIGCAR